MDVNDKIKQVLYSRGETSVANIQSNIVKNNQRVRGKALNSIGLEISGGYGYMDLTIGGISYIKTLEKGITPQEANLIPTVTLAKMLYGWTINKGGFSFESDKDRWWFSMHSAKRMQSLGSVLYRNGGREDVYTNESPILLENIMNDIGTIITDIKLIK